jgi:hypothetical protein
LTKRYHKVEAKREAALGDALKAAAAEFEREAQRLRDSATLAYSAASRHDRDAFLPTIIASITEQIFSFGKTRDEALAHAVFVYSHRYDYETEAEAQRALTSHFGHHYDQHLKANKETRQFIRNREIVRLAHTNTNAEISAAMARRGIKLHPKSISRIVQANLKRGRPRPGHALISPPAEQMAKIEDQRGGEQ